MNSVQKKLMEYLEQFGALREDQAEKMLKMHYPYISLNKTIFPLLTAHTILRNSGYVMTKSSSPHEKTIIAIDIMLSIQPEISEPILKGKEPFILTFFKNRDGKLWRYDICPVSYGTEVVISALVESINAKYRIIVFVLEKEEQMRGINVTCEHCYVLKNNGEYEFYLCSQEGE